MPRCCKQITALTNLARLDVSSSSIGDIGAEKLARALSALVGLTELHIEIRGRSYTGMAALLHALPGLAKLEALCLMCSGKSIDDNGVTALTHAMASLTQLRSLNIAECLEEYGATEKLMAALTSMTALTFLNMALNNIHDDTAALAAAHTQSLAAARPMCQ